jgi:predicted unusual protein kinase regulating ubiquinone biosynthesis (AarF/ABC1/UbiB family)
VLKRDPATFIEHMQALDMIAPGAEPGVRVAVEAMFERMGGGVLQQPTSGVLALKDEAKALLRETPGLQLPNDLLLYAKTLSYLFHLGDVLAPDVDMMKLAVPYLLRFLAERDPAPDEGRPAVGGEAGPQR